MLYYGRTDLSEGIDSAKSSDSKECMVCHYWIFNHGFNYPDPVCNGCHDFLIQCINISVSVIIVVKKIDYHCITDDITKCKAIRMLESYVLDYCGYM